MGWDGTGGGLLFSGVSRGHSARTKADLQMFGIVAHLCMPSMGPFVVRTCEATPFCQLSPSHPLVRRLVGWSVAQVKGLEVESLYVSHIQVNQAQRQRRRTYRAHGRINRKAPLPQCMGGAQGDWVLIV